MHVRPARACVLFFVQESKHSISDCLARSARAPASTPRLRSWLRPTTGPRRTSVALGILRTRESGQADTDNIDRNPMVRWGRSSGSAHDDSNQLITVGQRAGAQGRCDPVSWGAATLDKQLWYDKEGMAWVDPAPYTPYQPGFDARSPASRGRGCPA